VGFHFFSFKSRVIPFLDHSSRPDFWMLALGAFKNGFIKLIDIPTDTPQTTNL
jgi:hypothetical protein